MVILSSSLSAFGQEYIRGAGSAICDTSIIRAIGNDTTIIYNRGALSAFMLAESSVPVATCIIDPLYINDFEIDGKIVYFCGYVLTDSGKKGAFGQFNLATFTSGTLTYQIMDSCAELKKLDYYVYKEGAGVLYTESHVIMTGTTDGMRSDILVHLVARADVIMSPTPPIALTVHEAYFSADRNENFDDVAAIDNYVVVSTRNKVDEIPIIDFWQFAKPTTSLSTIFWSNILHLRMASPVPHSPVLLEHTTGNNYAATFSIFGFSKIAMLQLNATSTTIPMVEILVDEAQTLIPMDIKFNKAGKVFDILARKMQYDPPLLSVPMQIYHVTQDVLQNSVTYGNITRYIVNDYYHYVWSIDPFESSSLYTASGDSIHYPKLYKYKVNAWQHCPTRYQYQFILGNVTGVLKETEAIVQIWYDNKYYEKKLEKFSIDFEYECN